MTHANAPAPGPESGRPGGPPSPPRSTLVVTAHAGDFVWRAGGAIALAASRGEKVTISTLYNVPAGVTAKAWRE
ncbi:PIG-L family deacetylase, partial [Streptomyces sp. NPDC058683]